MSKFFKGFKQKDNYDWGYFLTKAVENNWLDEVKRIVEKKPEFVTDYDSFALIVASEKGNLEMVKFLYESGSSVEPSSVSYALQNKRNKVIDYFKENGIDLSDGKEMAERSFQQKKEQKELNRKNRRWF